MMRVLLLALLLLPLCVLALPVSAQQPHQLVVFSSLRDAATYEVYTMHTDGSNVVRLTNNVVNDLYPDIASDGSFVVYQQSDVIWQMNADSTGVRQIVAVAGALSPSLSSDETYISFAADTTGGSDLFTCYRESCNPYRVTYDGHPKRFPSWSDDSLQLAYSVNDGGGDSYGVYLVPASGGSAYEVFDEVYNESMCDFCGGRIVFHSNRDGDYELYTINPDGSGLTQLTFNTYKDYHPKFSPDCSQIVYAANPDGNDNEIYLMDADGSAPVRLTDNDYHDSYPAISGVPEVILPTPPATDPMTLTEVVDHLHRSEERGRVNTAVLLFMAVTVPVLLAYTVLRIRQR